MLSGLLRSRYLLDFWMLWQLELFFFDSLQGRLMRTDFADRRRPVAAFRLKIHAVLEPW